MHVIIECSASEWKIPTTFVYGYQDWMNYQGAQQARKDMKVPCEIIRVPQVSLSLPIRILVFFFSHTDDSQVIVAHEMQAGHFVFIDNPAGFHSAVLYACRRILSPDHAETQSLPEGLTSA